MTEVTVYSSMFCGYSHRAKALLDDKGVDYVEIDLLREPSRRLEMVERANGRKTVPQIFIGDVHVGGADDLFALERSGQLDRLLEDATRRSG